jgi:glycine/sarcosine N-methyltransferase
MYDAFSKDYDFFVNWPSRLAYELPLIEELIKLSISSNSPVSVLDAACGTGQHAIALARRSNALASYNVFGADYSAGMIAKAQQNRENSAIYVKFKLAGFGDLASNFHEEEEFPFDVVLCLGNSLPHLIHKDDLAKALKDFKACLKSGGMVLLQNRNFDAVLAGQQRWMEPQSAQNEGDEYLFVRFYDFRPDGLIDFNILSLRRENEKNWTQTLNSTMLRPLLAGELTSALSEAGFKDIACYGDLTGKAFDPLTSGNLIIKARA